MTEQLGRTTSGNAARAVPPVSIVVPVRDEPGALLGALASATAQDYEGEIEVIVADGSERPETAVAVRARFPQVRLGGAPALMAVPAPAPDLSARGVVRGRPQAVAQRRAIWAEERSSWPIDLSRQRILLRV